MNPRQRIRALRSLSALFRGDAAPSSESDWNALVELSDEHGLTPALFRACQDRGFRAPPAIHERMAERYRSNLGRTMVLRRQISDVVGLLDAAGVGSLLLKGAAHLADGVLADPAIREMSDIDVLIRPGDLPAAESALVRAGYERQPKPFGLEHHDILFHASREVAPVEIHVAVGRSEVAAELPTEAVWSRSRRVDLSGRAASVLSREDAVVHHILHAQVQDRDHAFFGLPLRQLHTFSLLGEAWGQDLDAPAIVDRVTRAGFEAPTLTHVDLARTIFGDDPLRGLRIPPRTRARRLGILASFALGWPTDVARNLRWAFEPEYLTARYGAPTASGGQRLLLRARHAKTLLSTGAGKRLSEATARLR